MHENCSSPRDGVLREGKGKQTDEADSFNSSPLYCMRSRGMCRLLWRIPGLRLRLRLRRGLLGLWSRLRVRLSRLWLPRLRLSGDWRSAILYARRWLLRRPCLLCLEAGTLDMAAWSVDLD